MRWSLGCVLSSSIGGPTGCQARVQVKQFRFKKINAFANGQSLGNPAGCIYLQNQNDISEKEMQLIATELKGYVSEVAFMFPENEAYYLRYYSSECEVDFCGHATIGLMHDYIKSHQELIHEKTLNIRVKNEILKVHNHIREENSVFITAPIPKYAKFGTGMDILAASLSIESGIIDTNLPIEIINAGLKTLIVPLKSLQQCLSVRPSEQILKSFCSANDIDIVLVFSRQVSNIENQYRTRVFAPKFGYLEDPATGSGNAAFGYYLLKNDQWNGRNINIEQNGNRDDYNLVKLATIADAGKFNVLFGGSSVVKIEGQYMIF